MLVFGSCGNKVFDLLSVCWVCGSGDYDRKKKDTFVCLVGCAVVSVFGSGGKLAGFLLWRESFITTGEKNIQSSVWRVRDEFVLVLVKIDLIHFEHSICISST